MNVTHTRAGTYTHARSNTQTRTHIHMHTHAHTHTYTRTHTHTHTHTRTHPLCICMHALHKQRRWANFSASLVTLPHFHQKAQCLQHRSDFHSCINDKPLRYFKGSPAFLANSSIFWQIIHTHARIHAHTHKHSQSHVHTPSQLCASYPALCLEVSINADWHPEPYTSF
jgi:hypothetical protein